MGNRNAVPDHRWTRFKSKTNVYHNKSFSFGDRAALWSTNRVQDIGENNHKHQHAGLPEKKVIEVNVWIICPNCQSKMVYQGGNVTVSLTPDEIGKTQQVDALKCQKCGTVQVAFYFKFGINNEAQQ